MPDDIKGLRERIKEFRALADGMNDRAVRAAMISIATSYEGMADQLEAALMRAAERGQSPKPKASGGRGEHKKIR
jgi:hypothetical protein